MVSLEILFNKMINKVKLIVENLSQIAFLTIILNYYFQLSNEIVPCFI